MNPRRWMGLCLGVAILAIAVWCAWTPMAIFYHKQCIALADRRLAAITKAKLAGNPSDHQNESMWYALRIHHTDRLVAAGYLFHASYEFNNLPDGSFPKHRDAILSSGMRTFPIRLDRYWSISTSDEPGGNTYRMVLNVYDLPEFKSQWDTFATTTIQEVSVAAPEFD